MRTQNDQRGSSVPYLQLSAAAMRSLGYGVVDAIVEHLTTLRDQPTARRADRATMETRLRESAPDHGTDPEAVLKRVLNDVLADGLRNSHPRYFSYVPNPSNFVGAMADALASGYNVFAGIWNTSPGAAQIELIVIDWLRQWCGLPDGAGGLLLSGSSMANMVGIAVARHARFGTDVDAARRGTLYYSDQAHSSVGRGARMLGIGDDRLRLVPTDEQFRLVPVALHRVIAEDRATGLEPFCVVASAGTTNTGAVDPLPQIADICAAEGLWLHADGAFGAAAVLSDSGRSRLDGLDLADSLALDAHKWMFQPIECGSLLIRDVRYLREAFHVRPEYLIDIDTATEEVNFCDLGPQLTRNFRALKLWMSIQVFGLDAFRSAIARGIELAEIAEVALHRDRRWQVVTPAQLGVITFRFLASGRSEGEIDALQAEIAQKCVDDGFAALSTTALRGRTVLRLCTINPRATDADIAETIRRLGEYGAQLSSITSRP